MWNVKDYGAVGDGSTDDTSAVQDAIDAASAGRGGVVSFSPGNYRLDGQITVDGDSVRCVGSGMGLSTDTGATVLDLRYASGPPILIGNLTTRRSWIGFEQMHLWAGSSAGEHYLFASRHVRGLSFRNVTFVGCWGFLAAGASSAPTLFVMMDQVEGSMRTTGHEHFLNLVNAPGGHKLTRVHAEGALPPTAGSSAIYHDGEPVDGLILSDCAFGDWDSGLRILSRMANCYVNNCTLDTVQSFGVQVRAQDASVATHSVTLSNCHLAGDQSGALSRGVYAQQSDGSIRNLLIANCQFKHFGAEGIWLTGDVSGVNIQGNIIHAVGEAQDDLYSAVRLGIGTSKLLVGGNVITAGSGNRPRYGINKETSDQDVVLGDNLIVGMATASVA